MSGFGKDVRTDLEGATARATFEPPPMLGCTDSSFLSFAFWVLWFRATAVVRSGHGFRIECSVLS